MAGKSSRFVQDVVTDSSAGLARRRLTFRDIFLSRESPISSKMIALVFVDSTVPRRAAAKPHWVAEAPVLGFLHMRIGSVALTQSRARHTVPLP